ncbi:MAG: hypothetical protein C7B45_13925 [Sulfobacillus acidophilus]|uniref:Uncharacterized protein n=1 Tax=Sulfobacillus acidophilus TaxID=53633 RepID=A0A2T2WEM4_9FIRM|nr:MAG: hypothetical protein C7B45_13925 [Sulfobacillus acidophilus]
MADKKLLKALELHQRETEERREQIAQQTGKSVQEIFNRINAVPLGNRRRPSSTANKRPSQKDDN